MSINDSQDFQSIFHYNFRNPRLLKEAFTHKSYVNESLDRGMSDNERLEFLGDAVLDMVISDYLFEKMPRAREGELSKIKSTVVSEPTLADVARKINIGKFILLGKGEDLSQGRSKNSLLANTLEAIIAAVYLDGGLSEAKSWIDRVFAETIENILTHQVTFDYKTNFQEECQKLFEVLPEYRLARSFGPDHSKNFEIELWVKDKLLGFGVGKSKKEAEQKAAKEGLNRLKGSGKNDLKI
ncbi:MAG: ribonuclease III [Nitrospiria bacterium]